MHRFAVLLSCALAGAVMAAPAPFPRQSQAWLAGWDRPADPLGGCRFERDGDRLTVTIPGPGHAWDSQHLRLNAPHLLRDVQGDFVAQVRVGGAFGPTSADGYQQAGLLLTDGVRFLRLTRLAMLPGEKDSDPVSLFNLSLGESASESTSSFDLYHGGLPGPPLEQPGYLRLERRGSMLRLAASLDGQKWVALDEPWRFDLPRKVKVGVVAETTAEGAFAPWFDQFRLLP